MRIIGLGHYSRTGKDYTANALIKSFAEYDSALRAGKISFAWKLKQMCHELYAWAGVREPEFYETPEGAKARDVVLPALGMTPVVLWVKFGTDAVREQVYGDSWIDFVLQTNHGLDVVIIPDVRFPNEVEAIKQAGGLLLKVVRPGYGPRPTKADRALLGYDGWDYIIGSTGDLEELEWWADKIANAIVLGGQWPKQDADERAECLSVEKLEAAV